MSIRELIISAFNDKEKGLTKNPNLLKQKNPQHIILLIESFKDK